MFTFTNVSKSYAKAKIKAVDNLNLQVNNGEIFGFLGPNGAGKTTTIKMLTGILQPDKQKHDTSKKTSENLASMYKPNFTPITIDGISIGDNPLKAKQQISFVPDSPEMFSQLKATEYLNFVGDVYSVPSKIRQERVTKYASLFGITENLNSRISSFSHGMKQKLFLTASLISDPQNWILDEPMVGLDPEAAFNLKELMKQRVAEGKTVFFSTHVMEVAEKICTKIGIIKKGSIIFLGTLNELREKHQNPDTDESLEAIFLRLTGMRSTSDSVKQED